MSKTPLSVVANVIMGQSPSGKFCGSSSNGLPLLNGPAEFTEFYPIPVQYTSDPKKVCNNGDILFCVRGSTTGRMNWADRQYAIGRGLAAISHKKGQAFNSFLKYLIEYNLDSLLNNANGSTFPNLTGDLLSSFKLCVPSEDKQELISKLLSTLDAKIELNNRINVELEAMAKTLYDYWFVQFDFPISKEQAKAMGKPELTGKPYKSSGGKMVYNETLKREIPEGWEDGTLGEVGVNIKNGVKSTDIDPKTAYIGLEHIPRKKIVLDIWSRAVDITSNKSVFNKRDILFGKLRPYFHKVGIAFVAGVCSTDILVLNSEDENDYGLFAMVVSNDDFIQYVSSGMEGTRMPRTKWEFMKKYSFAIPDDENTNQFNTVLKHILPQMEVNVYQNQQLAQLRDWLLPMLMNGQVTVK